MRPIKFRAWNGFDMSEPFELGDLDDSLLMPSIGDESKFVVDNCEIMQFTGLHDKNGKEIYEGDIVKDDTSGLGKIIWSDIMAGFDIDFGEERLIADTIDYDNVSSYFREHIEVIGNIYKNPELLEE